MCPHMSPGTKTHKQRWIIASVVVVALCVSIGFIVVPRYIASRPLVDAPDMIQTTGVPLSLGDGTYAGSSSTLVVVGPGGPSVLRGVNPTTGEQSWSLSLAQDSLTGDIDYSPYNGRSVATDEAGNLCVVDTMRDKQIAFLIDVESGSLLAQAELPGMLSSKKWVNLDGSATNIVCRANTVLILEEHSQTIDAYDFHRGVTEPHLLWSALLPENLNSVLSDVIDSMWVPTSLGYQSIPTGEVAKFGSSVYAETPISGNENEALTLFRQTDDGSVFQCVAVPGSFPSQLSLWDRVTNASWWNWPVGIQSCDSIYVEQFNNGTKYVLTSANGGRVSAYDYVSGAPLWIADEGVVVGLADGLPVASVSDNSQTTFRTFDLETGDLQLEVTQKTPWGTTVKENVVGGYLVMETISDDSIIVTVYDVTSDSTRPLWRTTLKLNKASVGVMGNFVVVTCGDTTYMLSIRPGGSAVPALGGAPTLHPTSTPPPAVPVDLVGDDPVPDSVVPRGVWSDVAIFELQYDAEDRPVGGTTIVRAASVTTGEILWTMETLPNGSPISEGVGVDQWNGKLALSIDAATHQESCEPDEYVLIVGLTTGEISSTGSFGSGCATNDDGSTHSYTTLVADYQEGIIVIDQFDTVTPSPPNINHRVTTTGYDDTDLTTPLWQSVREEGAPNTGFDAIVSDDSVLGQWVLTQSGTYVSIFDGRPSSAVAPEAVRGQQPLLFDKGGVLIEMTPGEYPWYATMSAWADVDLTQNLWSFSSPSGWGLDQGACWSKDAVLVNYINTDDILTPNTMVAAISMDTGELLWSKPLTESPIGPQPLICGFVNDGDKERVAYFSGAELEVVDVATGEQVGQGSGFLPDGAENENMYACGDHTVCLADSVPDYVLWTPTGTVTAVDVSSPDLEAQWMKTFTGVSAYSMAYETDSGLVAVGWDLSGTYQILKIG